MKKLVLVALLGMSVLKAEEAPRANTLANLQLALRHLTEEKQVLLQEVQFLATELDKVKAELLARKQLDIQLIAAHQSGEKNLEDTIKRFEESMTSFFKLQRDVNNLMTV